MTEKERAMKIFSQFYAILFDRSDAKDCAIIAIEEIVAETEDQEGSDEYWKGVINEIKKI